MDVCHSSPGWVGYGSQGHALKTAKPGYASRVADGERMGAIRRLLAGNWVSVQFRRTRWQRNEFRSNGF